MMSASEQSITPSSLEEAQLPPELWANVFHFLYFDEVLAVAALNNFFRSDVADHVKLLVVRQGHCLTFPTEFTDGFENVESIAICCLFSLTNEEGFLFDGEASRNVVPFLARFPNLERCSIGGNSDMDHYQFEQNSIICGEIGSVNCGPFYHSDEYKNCPINTKYGHMLVSFCRAFTSGDLSDDINFHGLLPSQEDHDHHCMWIDDVKIPSHRDDITSCQLCDLICMSFHPLDVINFTDDQLPCIFFENRLKIARCRNGKYFESNLTDRLEKEVGIVDEYKRVRFPPDYQTVGYCVSWELESYERMEVLISNGADAKDPSVSKVLIEDWKEKRYPWGIYADDEQDTSEKQAFTLETFDKLVELGFDIKREDVIVVDESDPKTSTSYWAILAIKEEHAKKKRKQ